MALDYMKYWLDLGLLPTQGIPEPPGKSKINPDAWREYASALTEYKAKMDAYLDGLIARAKEQADLIDAYYVDLVREYGISSNPKAAQLIRLVISQRENGAALEDIEKGVSALHELILPSQQASSRNAE